MDPIKASPASFTLTIPAGSNISNTQVVTFTIPPGQYIDAALTTNGSVTPYGGGITGIVELQWAAGTIVGRYLTGSYGGGAFSPFDLDQINLKAGKQLTVSVYDNGDVVGYDVIDTVGPLTLTLTPAPPLSVGPCSVTSGNARG